MNLQFTNALFVSDIHLSQDRPDCIRAFFEFLEWIPNSTESLFILGDFFEYWVGDDINTTLSDKVADKLKTLVVEKNIVLYFVTGNRDFALGKQYANRCHMKVLSDETIITVANQRILISHGDLLCTDDKHYQRFRKIIRNKFILKCLLSLPTRKRISIAEKLREKSKDKFIEQQTYIDVNEQAVSHSFSKHQVNFMVHGHTHIPDIHSTRDKNSVNLRMVLGDWHHSGWFGYFDSNGPSLQKFDILKPNFNKVTV